MRGREEPRHANKANEPATPVALTLALTPALRDWCFSCDFWHEYSSICLQRLWFWRAWIAVLGGPCRVPTCPET